MRQLERVQAIAAGDSRYAGETFAPWGSTVRLSATGEGTWDVWITDLGRIATWERTEEGARVTNLAGDIVAIVTTFNECAAVAGCGAQAGQWSDLAHKVLAGNCEIS